MGSNVEHLMLLKSFVKLWCQKENHFTAPCRASRKQHYYHLHQDLGDPLEQMEPKGPAHRCLAKVEQVKRLTGMKGSWGLYQ